MAAYAFSITKRVTWRGQAEEFSNVYHFDIDNVPDEEKCLATLNKLADEEKKIHANVVTFVRGRAYGPTDSGPAANIMRAVADFSGTGTLIPAGMIPYELAVVVQFYVGRGPRGGKQFIRKYFHSCGLLSSDGDTPGGSGNGPLTADDKTPFSTHMSNIKNLSVGTDNFPICTPNAKHLPLLSNPEVLNHLHTRQFRR